ncbi:hypothetical protein AKJ09_01538 [Labilithrix luteola]|uniref:Lipoprotein n=1 Tax=Labilithrix luteola TaxID=1391654 RepID=A0A0K1PP31_9BACT|nr:hypothetical protein [Labilithrix luteola]AKU94874.1 hypothetical protein AKJ09_01538 [Labilithrix luteola]
MSIWMRIVARSWPVLLVGACASSTSSPSSSHESADAGDSSDPGTSSGGPGDTSDAGGKTSLSGTLGALGSVQPTVSSLMISNSGETLIYLSSAPLDCAQLTVSRWLGSATKGSQVVEIVIKGAPKVGSVAVPPGEVNFAEGGKSSSYETNADSGKITFTKADSSMVEGTVKATYAGGGSVEGVFHAEFCANGQGY